MISILIPGCSVFSYGPVTNKSIIIDITENQKQIHSIGIFLNCDTVLEKDQGVGLYYSTFPYKNLYFIGAISNMFPRYVKLLAINS